MEFWSMEARLSALETAVKSLMETFSHTIEAIRSDLPRRPSYEVVQRDTRRKERSEEIYHTNSSGSGPFCYSALVRQKIADLKRRSSPSNPLCFRCGESGHLAYFCQNRILCFICGNHGHRAHECCSAQVEKLDNQNQLNRLMTEKEIKGAEREGQELDEVQCDKNEKHQVLLFTTLIIPWKQEHESNGTMLVHDEAGWGPSKIEAVFRQLMPESQWGMRDKGDKMYLIERKASNIGEEEATKLVIEGNSGNRGYLCNRGSSSTVEIKEPDKKMDSEEEKEGSLIGRGERGLREKTCWDKAKEEGEENRKVDIIDSVGAKTTKGETCADAKDTDKGKALASGYKQTSLISEDELDTVLVMNEKKEIIPTHSPTTNPKTQTIGADMVVSGLGATVKDTQNMTSGKEISEMQGEASAVMLTPTQQGGKSQSRRSTIRKLGVTSSILSRAKARKAHKMPLTLMEINVA